MTIAGFLPARAKYFWAGKSANVSGFLYTTLQSKCSLDAQERQAEKRFSYLRKWLIAASRQGRGNFPSSAAKCRRRCSKAFPPRSFASKLCPHSGPATASHRPSNKIVPGNATLLQTSSLSAVFTRRVVSNPSHSRARSSSTCLPSPGLSARTPPRFGDRASACTASIASVDPQPRHCVTGYARSKMRLLPH